MPYLKPNRLSPVSRKLPSPLPCGALVSLLHLPTDSSGEPTFLLTEQGFPTYPRVSACFLVGVGGIGGFASTHKAMTRTFIRYRIIRFARSLHGRDCVGNRGVNARGVSGIKAVHRGFDPGHRIFFWRSTVKDECRPQVRAISGESKCLATAPAEAADIELAARSRQLQPIVRSEERRVGK